MDDSKESKLSITTKYVILSIVSASVYWVYSPIGLNWLKFKDLVNIKIENV